MARVAWLSLLILLIIGAAPAPAAAQGSMRIDGTIETIDGQTMTVLSDTPINRGRATLGLSLQAVPAPRPTFTIDMSEVTASEYVFLREGMHVTVNGTLSQDGRKVIATSIVGPPRPQGPQAP